MAIAVAAAMIAVGLTAAAALMDGRCCLLVGPLFHITIAESCMPCSLYYEGNAAVVHRRNEPH